MIANITQQIKKISSLYTQKEAVRINGKGITYTELNSRSEKTAAYLLCTMKESGESLFGVYCEKSLEAVTVIIGILKAGASYVPIDYTSPLERIKNIITVCNIKTFFADSAGLNNLLEINKEAGLPLNIIVIDNPDQGAHSENINIILNDKIEEKESFTPLPTISENAIAAILFTSGSTGTPKGVMLTYGNIMAFVLWVIKFFKISEHDIFLNHSPFHFDLSLLDLFVPLLSGGTTILVPVKKSQNPWYLQKLADSEGITCWQSVPSILTLIAQFTRSQDRPLSKVRHVLFAGEPFPVKFLKKTMHLFNNATFYNIYGSTETNDTFIYRVPADMEKIPAVLPIGSPIDGVDYLILDEQGNPDPRNAEGELVVNVPTLMAGYWQGMEYDPAHYFCHEISQGKCKYYFRTKDLVIRNDDGLFMLSGRNDNIIKSSGYRINLTEIENILLGYEKISQAVVFAIDDEYTGKRIIAGVSTELHTRLSNIELKKYCAEKMPKYMIPSQFFLNHDKFKMTASGKIDRQYIINKYNRKRKEETVDNEK